MHRTAFAARRAQNWTDISPSDIPPPILDTAHIPLSPGGLRLLLHIMLPECCMHTLYQIYFIFVAAQSGRGKRPRCPEGRCVEGKYPTLQDCSIGMDFTAIFATSLVCWAGFGDNRELCRNGRTDRDAVWGVGQTLRGPRSHLLDGSAHWRHLANTTKQSVCGGDAVLRQITLATSLLWRSCSTCSTRWHCSTSRCCSSMLSRSPGNRSRS